MVPKFKILCQLTRMLIVCSKRMYGTQRQILAALIVFSLCLTTTFYFLVDRDHHMKMSLNDTNRLVQMHLQENLLQEKGTGCVMPEIDPFSEEVMKYNQNISKITCEGTDWVDCYKSECYVVKEILKTMKDVSCIYKDIVYVNDQIYIVSDPTKVIGDEKYMLNSSDHVKVSCTGTDLNSLGIVSSRWYGYKAGFRPVKTKPIPPDRQDSFNVMILSFDSASRGGFIRKMPKSYKYLSEKAIILNSYNVVGDGTSAALYPILTGMAEEEHPDARKTVVNNKYVDESLFIFHQLKGYGYRTAYFEDMPWIGTFQWKLNGFRRQPADHYLRAFLQEESKGGLKRFKSYPNRHCIGAVPQFQLMMNLADEFLQLDSKKFCFTFIADITHDNLNVFSTADEAVVSFIDTLAARRALDDTLVLVMGDHGPRFEAIRNTYQGKLEERLPFMAILLPEKLKKLKPNALAALKHNSDVLTTPFDIHATLLDVLDLKNKINMHRVPGSDLPRAMSLLDPIPKTRSCSEAAVMPHWCACTKWFNVSQSSPMYSQVATVLAEYIDSISQEQRPKCAKRNLVSIEWVLHHNVNIQLLKFRHLKESDSYLGNPITDVPRPPKEYYQAKVIMNPGGGIFEGTMLYNTNADYYTISYKDISRVNAYGDESNCVSSSHPHLSKYCYCRDHLGKQPVSNKSRDQL